MEVACLLVRCRECGEQGHMQKDLCYFSREVGHRRAACPMVKEGRSDRQRVDLALVVVVHLLQ